MARQAEFSQWHRHRRSSRRRGRRLRNWRRRPQNQRRHRRHSRRSRYTNYILNQELKLNVLFIRNDWYQPRQRHIRLFGIVVLEQRRSDASLSWSAPQPAVDPATSVQPNDCAHAQHHHLRSRRKWLLLLHLLQRQWKSTHIHHFFKSTILNISLKDRRICFVFSTGP